MKFSDWQFVTLALKGNSFNGSQRMTTTREAKAFGNPLDRTADERLAVSD